MLSIALDTTGTKMRLTCQNGRSSENISSALKSGGFEFEDYGTFWEINNTLDWKKVLSALNIDHDTAKRRKRQQHVLDVAL